MDDGLADIVEGFLVEHVMVGLGNIRTRIDLLEAERIAADEPPLLDLRAIAGQIDRLESRARAVRFLLRDHPRQAAVTAAPPFTPAATAPAALPCATGPVPDDDTPDVAAPARPEGPASAAPTKTGDSAAPAPVAAVDAGGPARAKGGQATPDNTPDTGRASLTTAADPLRHTAEAAAPAPAAETSSALAPDTTPESADRPSEPVGTTRERPAASAPAGDPDGLLASLVARLDRDGAGPPEASPRDATPPPDAAEAVDTGDAMTSHPASTDTETASHRDVTLTDQLLKAIATELGTDDPAAAASPAGGPQHADKAAAPRTKAVDEAQKPADDPGTAPPQAAPAQTAPGVAADRHPEATPVTAPPGVPRDTVQAATRSTGETAGEQEAVARAAPSMRPLLLVDPTRAACVPGPATLTAMPVFTSRRRRSAG